ncbi:hypothetical protein AX17_006553 [Amanita inopinata Kibby_2008]|nr:hypothetical protein AX17_006553 [Amanita inopinata Kibby_2008]
MDSDSLTNALSRILSPEMRNKALEDFHRDMSATSESLRCIPPNPYRDENIPIEPKDLQNSSRDELLATMQSWMEGMKPRFLPLESLNSMQECQKNHWSQHKQDCKNPMMSTDWKPAWTREGRRPSFMSDNKDQDILSKGAALWGNMPAIDVINLTANEKDPTRDFSLAFVASGDLRNVLLTVNSLPQDYSGHLNILFNDGTLPIVFRNAVLLYILGTVEDESLAADMALHFWYSAFLPVEYRIRISAVVTPFLANLYDNHPIGPLSTIRCLFPTDVKEHFLHFCSSSFPIGEAQEELDCVRNAPHRRDYRDRMYLLLRPSHRVAYQEFRRFGLVLPFGAANAHFNVPNASLFSLDQKWLQTDFADPLHGWDVNTVIRCGNAHGATSEDIYGCLYFFLADQLRTFARRLRQFRISFTVTGFEACALSKLIQKNELSEFLNLPSSIRFDRIEVSNIFDRNYVGLRSVLTHWAPLLRRNSTAAIVGYFMNWAMQREGRVFHADHKTRSKVIERLYREGRVPGLTPRDGQPLSIEDIQNSVIGAMGHAESLYDNSIPFSRYLTKQGLKSILMETKLDLREKHTIVPHRIHAALSASPDELPQFENDEDWYRWHELSSFTYTERYVEFICA